MLAFVMETIVKWSVYRK